MNGATVASGRERNVTFGMLVLVGGLVGLAAVFRCWTLVTAPSQPAELTAARSAVQQWLADTSPPPINDEGNIPASSLDPQLRALGVDRVEIQQFDPKALVVIRGGADGQPGVAGVDDNGDGLIDNRSELGATRSDDECVVVPSARDASVGIEEAEQEVTLVLQRGAFVPVTDPAELRTTKSRRAAVFGQSGGRPWSFVVQ